MDGIKNYYSHANLERGFGKVIRGHRLLELVHETDYFDLGPVVDLK